jgi:hypothetical protein
MAVCDECDAENRDEAQFCSSCGSKLTKPEILPSDKNNPFGLPDFGGNYPFFYTPTKVIPKRIREKLAVQFSKRLLLPFLIGVVLIFALIRYLSSN